MAVLNPRSAASLNKDWTLNLCKKKGDDAFTGLGLCKFRPVTWQAEGATYQSFVCISVWFTTPYSDTLQQSPGLCISKESYNVTCCKWKCVSDTQYFPSDWLKSTTFNGFSFHFPRGKLLILLTDRVARILATVAKKDVWNLGGIFVPSEGCFLYFFTLLIHLLWPFFPQC